MPNGHVFISYAWDDKAYVQKLVRWLSRRGVYAWFDEDIATGQRWEEVLRAQIESCRALLVVMTHAAATSSWVGREIEYARSLGKPVLPLRLSGTIPSLDPIQSEDVRGGVMPGLAFLERLRGMAPARRVVGYQIGLIPEKAGCYQHRTVANVLDAALVTGDKANVIASGPEPQILSGMSGVGKTQLAASLARRLRDAGQVDLVVWLGAENREGILSQYAHASEVMLGIDHSDPQSAREFLTHLGTTTSQWLVVLDDLVDPRDLDGLWPPRTATGRVVVTTRRRDAGLTGHGRVVVVGTFTADEAYAYLAEKLGGDTRRLEQAHELIDDLGSLPVALAQAAAYIADRDLTCGEYRARFHAHPLAAMAPSTLPDDYTKSVAVCVWLAIDAADHLDPVGLARPLLLVLSLLDPNGIPSDLVTSAPLVAYLSHTTHAPVDRELAHDSLACLHRLNLSSTSSESHLAESRVYVHALVQRAIRDQTIATNVSMAAVAAADALMAIWPSVERETSVGQMLRNNAMALWAAAGNSLWQPDCHDLVLRLGRSLGEAGHVMAAVAFFETTVVEAATRLGTDHSDSLTLRQELAWWYGATGDVSRAITSLEALVADRIRLQGPDRPETLTARHELGRWRGVSGDVSKAVADLEVLLADYVRALNADHPGALVTRHELARLRGVSGDIATAITELDTLLGDYVRILGPEHPGTLTTRFELTRLKGAAPDVTAAIADFEVLHSDYIRILGPDHPGTLVVRYELARLKGASGETATAIAELDTLVDDYVRILGSDHPGTQTARFELSRLRADAPPRAVSRDQGRRRWFGYPWRSRWPS